MIFNVLATCKLCYFFVRDILAMSTKENILMMSSVFNQWVFIASIVCLQFNWAFDFDLQE